MLYCSIFREPICQYFQCVTVEKCNFSSFVNATFLHEKLWPTPPLDPCFAKTILGSGNTVLLSWQYTEQSDGQLSRVQTAFFLLFSDEVLSGFNSADHIYSESNDKSQEKTTGDASYHLAPNLLKNFVCALLNRDKVNCTKALSHCLSNFQLHSQLSVNNSGKMKSDSFPMFEFCGCGYRYVRLARLAMDSVR